MSILALVVALGAAATPAAVHGADEDTKAAEEIREFVGVWDLPETLTQIKIHADHTVDHSRLGSGTIKRNDVGIYRITYRHLHLNCYYQIKRYKDDELSLVVAVQPSEQDCDLGILRRSPSQENAATDRKPAATALPPTSVFKDCPDCPDMTVVPAGAFEMGSRDNEPGRYGVEGPVRIVTFAKPFAVSRYAITLEQFEAFAKAKGLADVGNCRVQGQSDWVIVAAATFRAPGFKQEGNHPVVCISWQDASDYAAWLSERSGLRYRLLSEAEFEYVARAGTATPYWWGGAPDPRRAHYDASEPGAASLDAPAPGASPTPVKAQGASAPPSSPSGTVPVQYFTPNPWGFFQVHGNAASWVADCWNKTLAGAPADGTPSQTGDCSRRAVRGGAWTSYARDMRSAYRESAPAVERYYQIGFRVARSLD